MKMTFFCFDFLYKFYYHLNKKYIKYAYINCDLILQLIYIIIQVITRARILIPKTVHLKYLIKKEKKGPNNKSIYNLKINQK